MMLSTSKVWQFRVKLSIKTACIKIVVQNLNGNCLMRSLIKILNFWYKNNALHTKRKFEINDFWMIIFTPMAAKKSYFAQNSLRIVWLLMHWQHSLLAFQAP